MDLKFLIVLFYYDRSNLVKNSLKSILDQSYSNFEVAFIDDGSSIHGEPIAREIFSNNLDNISFYRIEDTIEDKMNRNGVNGSLMGKYANIAISNSDADCVFMLCDDDVLYPGYINNLNNWFIKNENENYTYSHIVPYNPLIESTSDITEQRTHHLNKTGSICPFYAVDMSQVAWRRKPQLDADISFPYPFTVNIDAEVFLQMHKNWGDVSFSGFISQYKAIYPDNLSHRMGNFIGGRTNDMEIFNIKFK